MNRSADVRRHHRDRVIRKRVMFAEMFGGGDLNRPGMFGKSHKVRWWWNDAHRKGSYLADGYQRRGWWDGGDGINVRRRMKEDLRHEIREEWRQ